MRVVIVGAGIGGLAAAHYLGRGGHQITVVEEADRLRTSGAAVSLWFNGAAVLQRLAMPLESMGTPIGRLLQGSTDGRIMFDLDASRLAARFGVTSVTMPRRRLLTALADGLPPDSLRFGVAARGVRPRPDAAVVELADGTELEADLVVGADGARSVVRSLFVQDGPARPTGWVAWQGLTESPLAGELGTTSLVIVGEGGYCGLMPAGDGLLQWWFHQQASPDQPAEAALAMLRSRYGRWPRPVPQLLDSLTSTEIECWPYVYHRVPARYACPGVVLIGDAVHAMPPSLAQGISQTLEDVWVLARELERRPDPADALLAYQRARRLKVLAVSRQASSSFSQRADGWLMRHATLPSPVLTSVFGTYLRAVSNILSEGRHAD